MFYPSLTLGMPFGTRPPDHLGMPLTALAFESILLAPFFSWTERAAGTLLAISPVFLRLAAPLLACSYHPTEFSLDLARADRISFFIELFAFAKA